MKYSISRDKLQEVVAIFNADNGVTASEEKIKSVLCYDWPQGQEHQDWLDTANAQEISNWLYYTI